MQLSVDVRAAEVLKGLALGEKQIAYAIANSINSTVKAGQERERARVLTTFHVRKKEFIERQVAVIKPFASAKEKRFSATVSVGQKSRLLLSQFETGGVRMPFKGKNVAVPITGSAARPTIGSSVPDAFTFKGLRLTKTGRGRKGPRVRGANGSNPQIKGQNRSFLLRHSAAAPLGAVFQRVGPGRGDIRMIYSFRHAPQLRAVLQFHKTMETTARLIFPGLLAGEVVKGLQHNLKKLGVI